MKLSTFKERLETLENVAFRLPNGGLVPAHYHITEVGVVTKNFIDCGGVVRAEQVANFQLWHTYDVAHRLKPRKLLNIIALSERKLGIEDLDIEVEYQGETIGKYGLDFDGQHFVLTPKFTDCLAKDNCGVPEAVTNTVAAVRQKAFQIQEVAAGCCTPNSGCC
jgi:hypothetical protein